MDERDSWYWRLAEQGGWRGALWYLIFFLQILLVIAAVIWFSALDFTNFPQPF